MPVDKLTVDQFAQKIKAKYPQYKDVNDSVLVEKIIAKHPEYKERVNVQQTQTAPTSEMPTQQAFKVQISEPTFKSAPTQEPPVRSFTDQRPYDEHGLVKLQRKAQLAKENIDTELHLNDAQYEKNIRQIRSDAFTMEDLKKEAKEKGYIIPIGKENEYLKLAKERRYNLPVSPEDISDIKTGTILNNDASRQFIKQINNPKAQKSAYLVDAYNHASNDINGLDRVEKIKENAKKIEKQEYEYDPVSMTLGKRQGFIGSVFAGRKELDNSFDLYEYIRSAPDASITDRLNREITQDIDEPVSLPEGMMGNLGHMIGGQPIKGLLGGGIAAAGASLSGNPEAAPAAFKLVSAGLSAVDMYRVGFANALKSNYAMFKQQGLSDNEALQKAKPIAEDQANIDAASAAAMSFAAGKTAFKPTGLTLSTLNKSLSSALTQIGEAGGKKALEGLGVGSIGGVTQIIKNIQAQNAGLPVETIEGVGDQIKAGALLTVATHVIAKSANALKPSTLNKLTKSLSNVPKEVIDNNITEQEQAGHISPEEARTARELLSEAKGVYGAIPDDIPETDRIKIAEKIKERNTLKNKLEQVDEAYHPEIKEKIKGLNEQIINISKGSDRGDLQSLINKEINAGNIHGDAVEPFKNATEKELEQYMKDISEQAHDPATEQAAIDAFGANIVNKAKELYPVSYERLKEKELNELKNGIEKRRKDELSSRTEPQKYYSFIKNKEISSADIHLPEVGSWHNDRSATLYGGNNKIETFDLTDAELNELKKSNTREERAALKQKIAERRLSEIELEINKKYDDEINSLNSKENAETIRSDEGQVSQPGIEPSGGQEQSGGNIQFHAEETPINGETEQQAGEQQQAGDVQGEKVNPMEGGIPPNMLDLPFTPEEGDVGRLAHADTEKIYRDLGMTDRVPRATKNDIALESEADEMIRNGYDFEGKADRVISGRDKSFTDAEQVAFAKMVGALNVKLQSLDVNSPEFNSTWETIERLSRASDIVGSEEGAAFRARRMFVLNDETLSSFLKRAKDANMDAPLTDEQIRDVKSRFDDLMATKEAYRARLEKLAADYKKLQAEKAIKSASKEKSTSKDYKAERKDILDSIAKKWKDNSKLSVAVVPYADKLVAIAPDVMKLVANIVRDGIDKLPDVIDAVHNYLKDNLPELTKEDVHNIIAGEYSQKQTKTSLQEKIAEIKMEATLINRLESLKAGVQPKSERQRKIRSAEIEKLRGQIKELTDRPEKTEAENLAALKARYKKQTAELQKKIDEGDFEPEERKELELDKEAQDLKDAYIKKKIEWQKHIAQEAYNNRTTGEKAKDRVIEVLNIPRTLMASADLSAPLRQGLVVTASHPGIASKAFVESVRQAISPARFDRWLYDLKESEYYKNVLEKSGLYIADPNNLHLSAKEEAFMTNLAEKIPLIGDTLKLGKFGKKIGLGEDAKLPGLGIVSKSERAYVAYLNKMRVDIFTMYAKALADDKMTPKTHPEVYEGLATFVNAATGRGELGALEPAAKVLNTVFFSPRLMASRINMLNPVWYASLPRAVRIMALKDMGKTIGLGAATLTLLSMVPGIKVETDPRSTDFGKVHAGNTRWDIWGGFQQYVRVMAQVLSQKEKKGDGSVVPLGSKIGQESAGTKILKLFRGKLAPIPSIVTDIAMGKTATGEDVELKSELKEHLIPMIGNDIADAWKEQGPASIAAVGIPSFLGIGTTTYESKSPKSKSHAHSKNSKSKHKKHIKK